jgi:hypothetical protein
MRVIKRFRSKIKVLNRKTRKQTVMESGRWREERQNKYRRMQGLLLNNSI